MKYTLKRLSALLMALSLIISLSAAAYAHEVPDYSREGAITVKMHYDGKAVTGGVLTAYRVGEVVEVNGDFVFEKTAQLSSFSGSYENIEDSKLPQELAEYVSKNKTPAYATAENSGGEAVFIDLELGLYLIVQTTQSNGYEPINAFLVSVPMFEDGEYVYNIDANGKFQLVQSPPSPNPSKDPSLPQTGQLNWPVPLLASLGALLLLLGCWVLRSGRKEQESQ